MHALHAIQLIAVDMETSLLLRSEMIDAIKEKSASLHGDVFKLSDLRQDLIDFANNPKHTFLGSLYSRYKNGAGLSTTILFRALNRTSDDSLNGARPALRDLHKGVVKRSLCDDSIKQSIFSNIKN